jgi:hypothetical protein
MGVDERARHRLCRRLEEVLGPEEAGTLMNHLPPAGLSDLATKAELAAVEERLIARIEQMGRRIVMWTSSMVLASAALAFAAGRLA